MLTLEEAQEQIFAALSSLLEVEKVSVAAASGRVLAVDVLAVVDLPGFDNSAMDGYAVRAADVAGASPE